MNYSSTDTVARDKGEINLERDSRDGALRNNYSNELTILFEQRRLGIIEAVARSRRD